MLRFLMSRMLWAVMLYRASAVFSNQLAGNLDLEGMLGPGQQPQKQQLTADWKVLSDDDRKERAFSFFVRDVWLELQATKSCIHILHENVNTFMKTCFKVEVNSGSQQSLFRFSFEWPTSTGEAVVITVDQSNPSASWSSHPDFCDLDDLADGAPEPISAESDSRVSRAFYLLDALSRNCSEHPVTEMKFIALSVFRTGTASPANALLTIIYKVVIDGTELPHRWVKVSEETGSIIVSQVSRCDIFSNKEETQGTGSFSVNSLLEQRKQQFWQAVRLSRSDTWASAHAFGLPLWKLPLEDEFDWRNRMPLCFSGREVQDQGVCGSCWAFAALGSAADRRCLSQADGWLEARTIDGAVYYQNARTNENAWKFPADVSRFAVQDFLSCHMKAGKDGCDGNSLDEAHEAMLKGEFSLEHETPYIQKCTLSTSGGVVNDVFNARECGPFAGMPDDPRNSKPCHCWQSRPISTPPCKQNRKRVKVQHSWGSLKFLGDLSLQKKQELIKRIIRQSGPVSAGMMIWDDFNGWMVAQPLNTYRRHNREASWRGGHAVVITGWGKSENGETYWWVRNSWGKSWGLGGYFKVLMGRHSNSIGIEAKVAFSILSPETVLAMPEGVRPPWQDSFDKDWGTFTRKLDMFKQAYWQYRAPEPGTSVPVEIKVHVDRMTVLEDSFSDFPGGSMFLQGKFIPLQLVIPFQCSRPCSVQFCWLGHGRTTESLRCHSELDDSSWTSGHVRIQLNSSFFGASNFKAVLTFERTIASKLQERYGYQQLRDLYNMPSKSTDVAIVIPRILHHSKQVLPKQPEIPFIVTIQLDEEFMEYLRSLGILMKSSSEPAVFSIRAVDNATGRVLAEELPGAFPASESNWKYLGGGESFGAQNFFEPSGAGNGRLITIEVTGTVKGKYAKDLSSTARINYQARRLHPPPAPPAPQAPPALPARPAPKQPTSRGLRIKDIEWKTSDPFDFESRYVQISAETDQPSTWKLSIVDQDMHATLAGWQSSLDQSSTTMTVHWGGKQSIDKEPDAVQPWMPWANDSLLLKVTATPAKSAPQKMRPGLIIINGGEEIAEHAYLPFRVPAKPDLNLQISEARIRSTGSLALAISSAKPIQVRVRIYYPKNSGSVLLAERTVSAPSTRHAFELARTAGGEAWRREDLDIEVKGTWNPRGYSYSDKIIKRIPLRQRP